MCYFHGLVSSLYFRFYFAIIGSVCESWTAPHGRLYVDLRVVTAQLLDTAEALPYGLASWLLQIGCCVVQRIQITILRITLSICIWINPLRFLEPKIYLFLHKFRLVPTKYKWKRLAGNIRVLNHSTRWRSRGVASSVPDGVFRIFHWLNPSGLSTFTNLNEYQGDKCGRCVRRTALPPSCADNVEKSVSLHLLKAWRPVQVSVGIAWNHSWIKICLWFCVFLNSFVLISFIAEMYAI
jgi:hypothetical protein